MMKNYSVTIPVKSDITIMVLSDSEKTINVDDVITKAIEEQPYVTWEFDIDGDVKIVEIESDVLKVRNPLPSVKERFLAECPECKRKDMLIITESFNEGVITKTTKECYCGYEDEDVY